MKITIIGAGQLGAAIKSILAAEPEAELWDKQPGKVPGQKELSAIIPDSKFVFLCVPAAALRAAAGQIREFLSADSFVVAASKGLEQPSGNLSHQILEEFFPAKQVAIISGPMLAQEILAGLGCAAVIASENPNISSIQNMFKANAIKLEFSTDLKSTALAGVLKNIYAMLFGAADGLGWGGNLKGLLASKAVLECQAIAEIFGADRQIMLGVAGLADLIATGFSADSLNRQAGEIAVQNFAGKVSKTVAPNSEGMAALPLLLNKLGSHGNQLPLLSAAKAIFLENANPSTALKISAL